MALTSSSIISLGSVVAAVLGVSIGLDYRPVYPVQYGPRMELLADANGATGTAPPAGIPPARARN
jgi:hypothetical protein